MTQTPPDPFWKVKPLEAMDADEWESLCDGCGRCCLVKLEDEDSGAIAYTDIGCRLLDDDGCRCRDYDNRQAQVPDCVRLTPQTVRALSWLPPSCGYRLVAEGRDLYWWHPLVSGDTDTVHAAGVSVRGRVSALEDELPFADYLDRMVRWPTRLPKPAARRKIRA
ncbi:MAG TPA: YcgN family cysteine cluster protein [Xanthobacteraceae bacterium]|nr:YcgN family cysteine cluster protein [Xanthobacteraceae bacterium]